MKARRHRMPFPMPYYHGRAARRNGKCRLAQPYGNMTIDGGWWLGGWHDADMELSRENQKSAATAQAA